jgi:hypothetical protein
LEPGRVIYLFHLINAHVMELNLVGDHSGTKFEKYLNKLKKLSKPNHILKY